jgi:uncharacterized protein (TIGR02271 family)
MGYERIVAVYDSNAKAKDAARALESSGFSSSEISFIHRDSLSDKDVHDGNLWQRLFGRVVSDSESTSYNRALQSGGTILSMRAKDTEVPRAMKILDAHERLDLNERSTTTAAGHPTSGAKADARDEVLRLVEEQLDLGKRQVETGRSRIRYFVVEKPVESQITLHEEHLEISRRAVTDATLPRDLDWKDKTIEVIETSEQPVVTKTARITEEVVISRRGSDRVQTIRDTVRRQQVEVERVPGDIKKAA